MSHPHVVVTSPSWHLSGVNTFHSNLAKGLVSEGFEVEILLTQESREIADQLREETGMSFHALSKGDDPSWLSWPRRWRETIDFLESRGPCVFLPGYDFDVAAITPALPASVRTIGVLHSDEPFYYDNFARLGHSWDAVVGVSRFIVDESRRIAPQLAERVRHIPYGVNIPESPPERGAHAGRLKVVFAGRLSQKQKRVLYLIPLLRELERLDAPVTLTVVGSGPEETVLRRECAGFVARGLVDFVGSVANDTVLGMFEKADVLLLLSDHEGLPVVMLEAMARGCVPVVTDIRSGIPELVEHGVNGYRFPTELKAFADSFIGLQQNGDRRKAMSKAARQTILSGPYAISEMIRAYSSLIDELDATPATERPGRVSPPPHLQPVSRWRNALAVSVRRVLGLRSKAVR